MTAGKKFPPRAAVFRKAYWRAEDAREVLAEWRRSGVTLTEFARREGLSRNRLAWWRARLGVERAPRFHRIELIHAPTTAGVGGSSGEAIEILVGGGRRVAVRRGFDPDLLAEVLRVLESRGC